MNGNKWVIHFEDGSDYTYCGCYDGAVAHAEDWVAVLGSYTIEPCKWGYEKGGS